MYGLLKAWVGVLGPLGVEVGSAACGHQVGALAMSLGRRTRLWATAVRVNTQPTRSSSRCRVLGQLAGNLDPAPLAGLAQTAFAGDGEGRVTTRSRTVSTNSSTS